MAERIMDILNGLSEDPELKLAAEKIGHEPEMPNPSDAGMEGELGAQMGTTSMDARAKLQEKALQAAGDQLDVRTFQDPREDLTAQATAPMGTQNVAPTDTGRNMRDTKDGLPSTVNKAAEEKKAGKYVAKAKAKDKDHGKGYAMGMKKKASLADYVAVLMQEDGEKTASEQFSPGQLAEFEVQAQTGVFMGRAQALGHIKEALGK